MSSGHQSKFAIGKACDENYRKPISKNITLQTLAQKYGVSAERIRQIDVKAMKQMRKVIEIECSAATKKTRVNPGFLFGLQHLELRCLTRGNIHHQSRRQIQPRLNGADEHVFGVR